ncbi:MAG TPA: DUF6703 family protein [Pedococcus sp.]|nr:DUF6703 family protein [Pedococcus sp.]
MRRRLLCACTALNGDRRRPRTPVAGPAVGLPSVSSFRESLERASLPLVERLSRLPRAFPFLIVLALLVGGILIPGWGWVLTGLVALFLAWVLVLGWPRLKPVERLMRIAVLFMAVAIAVAQAVPRG